MNWKDRVFVVVVVALAVFVIYKMPRQITILPMASQTTTAVDSLGIRVGDTIRVYGWQWIQVANPKGISNGNCHFTFGDEVGIDDGGTLKVVKIKGEKTLMEYTTDKSAYGTQCPSGALVYIANQELCDLMQHQAKEKTTLEMRNVALKEVSNMVNSPEK